MTLFAHLRYALARHFTILPTPQDVLELVNEAAVLPPGWTVLPHAHDGHMSPVSITFFFNNAEMATLHIQGSVDGHVLTLVMHTTAIAEKQAVLTVINTLSGTINARIRNHAAAFEQRSLRAQHMPALNALQQATVKARHSPYS